MRQGGTFTQEWEVFHAGLAKLPGNHEHWPLDVRVDGKPAAVVSSDDDPALDLAAGHHLVTGRFAWDEALPDGLAVPPETGLLALTVNGKRIDFPVRDEDGQVFLGRKEVAAEADSVDISVHRKLVDEIPLRLITRLQLAVSGKSREVVLGRALPAGFEAQAGRGRSAVALRSGWSRPRSGAARHLDDHADRAPDRRRRQRDAAAARRALERRRGGLGLREPPRAAPGRRERRAGDRSGADHLARRLEVAARPTRCRPARR